MVEEYPPHIQEPLGKPVSTSCFVDTDHVSNVVTRNSHDEILLFVCNALIKSLNKKLNKVQLITFR